MEEHIFSWSLDGFGSTLFRISENGKYRFINRYSTMDMDENDVWSKGNVEYNSFEDFWMDFTDRPIWLRYRPIFVHKDYKPFLRKFFNDIPQGSLTMGEICRLNLWLFKID